MSTSLTRNRDFRRLWVSQTLSLFGSGASNLAYPLLVLAMTGSAVHAGIVGTVSGAAAVGCQLPGGGLVDRWNRRRLMLGCQLIRFAAMAAIAAAIMAGDATLWMIIIAATVTAAAGSLFGSAEQAALRHIVTVEQLPQAVSLNEARSHAADLAGPAAGGAMFGAARWLPFGVDALSYAVSVVAVALIRRPLQETRDRVRTKLTAEIGEGIKVVFRDPFLRAVAFIAPPLNVAISCVMFVLIVVLRDQGAPSAAIGSAETAIALGGLAGALLTPFFRRRLRDRTLVVTLCWAMTALVAAMAGLVGTYAVIVPLAFALLLAPASNATIFGYLFATTPDRLQGRVVSTLTLFAGGIQPIAPVAGGVMVQQWGGRVAFIGCAAVLAVGALAATFSNGIRQMRPLTELKDEAESSKETIPRTGGADR